MAEHPTGTTVHGLEFNELREDDAVARTLTLRVRNHFLRSHAVHVQFANEAGTPARQSTGTSSIRIEQRTTAVAVARLAGSGIDGEWRIEWCRRK